MTGTRSFAWVLMAVLALLAGCGSGSPFEGNLATLTTMTQTAPSAGAGEMYSFVIQYEAGGGAALPDKFEIDSGSLPPGLHLMADRVDADQNGIPDQYGALTGYARVIGFPYEKGSYTFSIKAISTGGSANPKQPDLASTQQYTITVGEGRVTFISPTAAEGTIDPTVPAFPEVVEFVNPANVQAFLSYSFLVAGGSGNNTLNIYMPRELELSIFDAAVVAGTEANSFDSDESGTTGDPMEVDFGDGGLFVLQAGQRKVQIGGFQSPRGKVGTITSYAGGPGLNPLWFQKAPNAGGPQQNSRRDLLDSAGIGTADATLGTPLPVVFSDYFSALYEGTNPGFNAPPLVRRKYPFTADQYQNAFFVSFTPGVDTTELRFRLIAEAIDTRGSVTKDDDLISRKAYVAQVKIPDIKIDTVTLPAGTAGVDYTEFVNASGGVPPLTFMLEFVDSTLDYDTTPGSALLKADFGLEMDTATGQFFGVPMASGTVELSVTVYGDVMNPSQSGAQYLPTGANPGEYNGTNPDTGMPGAHRTYQVDFAIPSAPYITNTSLAGGEDGVAYPGDRVVGTGGVPKMIPSPVGFVGTYPASQVTRAFDFSVSYIRDSSYGVDKGTVDPTNPLPRSLVFDGDANSPNNGRITGVATDRGFHPLTFEQMDYYLGDAAAPSLANRQSSERMLPLSISPDSAVYVRGTSTTNGGTPNGLLDGSTQMGEIRMAPIFLQGAIHRVDTGSPAVLFNSQVPRKLDFLPVALANGGSDSHVDKSIPSVSGFWPAESNRNDRWEYYSYGNVSPYLGWKHMQQEQCWIQTPTDQQYRVFLFGEPKMKSTTQGRYGVMDTASGKKRGVMILNPLSGDLWFPAILTNNNSDHGSQFGNEDIWGTSAYCINNSSYSDSYAYIYGYVYGGYPNMYYCYNQYNQGCREARLTGIGLHIEALTSGTYQNKVPFGRITNSVAVSADGLWGATALPGGNGPKILLWRNDMQQIPTAFAAQGHVTMLDGLDPEGSTLSNSACIVDVSAYGADQRYLLPDSLMFVKDGLLFLMERRLSYVHAMSLADGHLSTRSINTRFVPNGFGPSAGSTTGQPIPDTDVFMGMKRVMPSMAQFSFAGNRPATGEEGPDKVAFIAGSLYNIDPMADSYSANAYYRLSSDVPRKGYGQGCTGNKAVLFLTMQEGANGLDLNTSGTEIRDLTGSDSRIYGDFLTPGRSGELLDFVAVSPDGRYVAAVRNVGLGIYSYYYYSIQGTYGAYSTTTSTTTDYYQSADDILLFSTDGTDLDSASGIQNVLFLGTGLMGSGNSGANSVSYVSAQTYLDAYSRRIAGVQFSDDSKSLIFTYAGHNSYNAKYMGSAYQYTINNTSRSTTYHAAGAVMSVQFNFRTSSDGPINFGSTPGDFLKNMLSGLTSVGNIGDTSVPFGDSAGGDQQFWATFRSSNGKFLYYISDPYPSANFMVGFNVSDQDINGHQPFTPFLTHDSTIGFEQFDCPSWNYECRFFAVPAGVKYQLSGRDGDGIVFVIGSAASAGATSATDLEVYAFDANNGGQLVALTSDATDGTANALNHMYVSADGNFLIVQRTKTTSDSGDTRAELNNANDLIAVNNVHAAVFDGAPATSFIVSADKSHGSSVAFVGEGTATGPQAVIYSAANKGSSNTTWATRTLRLSLLAPGAPPAVLDSTQSHYFVLSGTRRVNDDPNTSN